MYSVTLAFKAMCKHCSTVFRGNLNTRSLHLLSITQVPLISSLDSYSFLKVSATKSTYILVMKRKATMSWVKTRTFAGVLNYRRINTHLRFEACLVKSTKIQQLTVTPGTDPTDGIYHLI